MKFGKRIREHSIPGWEDAYIDYKTLKQVIKRAQEDQRTQPHTSHQAGDGSSVDSTGGDEQTAPASPHVTYFLHLIDAQLTKVESFFTVTLASLQRRAAAVERKAKDSIVAAESGSPRQLPLRPVLTGARNLQQDVAALQHFARMNAEGFRKISKKLDKKLHLSYSSVIMRRVATFSFAHSSDLLDDLASRTRNQVRKLSQLMGDVPQVPTQQDDVLESVTQLIREGSLAEIKAIVVQGSEDASHHGDTSFMLVQAALRINRDDDADDDADGDHSKSQQDSEDSHMLRPSSSSSDDLLKPAAPTERLKALRLISDAGADILAADDVSWKNVLHIAASSNLPELVSELTELLPRNRLVAAVAMPDALGRLPLHTAASKGHSRMVRALLRCGADVNARALDGTSALDQAIKNGHTRAVRSLLRAGAVDWPAVDARALDASRDVDAMSRARSGSGSIPKSEAILDSGSDSDSESPLTGGDDGMAAAASARARAVHRSLLPAVCLAAYNGHAGVLRMLLDWPTMDPLALDPSTGESALHKAAAIGCVDCCDMLLERCPTLVDQRDKCLYRTPLFCAAVENHMSVVKVLVDHGATVSCVDARGWTAKTYALFRGHTELADELHSLTMAASAHQAACDGKSDGAVPPSFQQRYLADTTSFIDKEGKFRARGHEKTVSVSERQYGHEYLTDHARLILTISDVEMLVSKFMDATNGVYLTPKECQLRMTLMLDGKRVDMQHVPFPVDPDTELCFTLPAEVTRPSLSFDLVSVFDDKVVGGGIMTSLDWRSVPEQHRTLSCTVVAPSFKPLCVVSYKYLLVTPFRHPGVHIGQKTYWRASKSLPVWGHRGSGAVKAARVSSEAVHRTHIQENTVLSFVTAASLGAEYVEFDVQFTRDGVPVVYHNWTVEETGYEIPVNLLTYDEFRRISDRRAYPGHRKRNSRADLLHLDPDMPAARENGAADSSKGSASPHNSPRPLTRSLSEPDLSATNFDPQALDVAARHYVRAPPTSLVETFQRVPRLLGFNIELKYPLWESQQGHQLNPPDINAYLDAVLKVVYEHAGDRQIVFSCFHPDVARAACLKQPNYPVFFLTSAGFFEKYSDPRAMSLQAAVRFARDSNLLGVVSHCRPFLMCPELVREVKASGLLLLTWGKENNEVESVKIQQSCGVDAIITDHVAHVRRGLKPLEN